MSRGLFPHGLAPEPDRDGRVVTARCLLEALIVFNGGLSRIKCIVKSLSAHEARIDVSAAWYLPNAFDLYLVQKQDTLHGVQTSREGDMVTVAIRTSCDPDTDHRRAIEELATDNANLRNATRLMADRLMALGKAVDITEPPSHAVVPNIFSPG